MDAAFLFVELCPAAGAFAFAGFGQGCTGFAADGGVTPLNEWVFGEVAFFPFFVDHLLRPIGDGVDFDAAIVVLHFGQGGAAAAVDAFTAVDPGIEAVEGFF